MSFWRRQAKEDTTTEKNEDDLNTEKEQSDEVKDDRKYTSFWRRQVKEDANSENDPNTEKEGGEGKEKMYTSFWRRQVKEDATSENDQNTEKKESEEGKEGKKYTSFWKRQVKETPEDDEITEKESDEDSDRPKDDKNYISLWKRQIKVEPEEVESTEVKPRFWKRFSKESTTKTYSESEEEIHFPDEDPNAKKKQPEIPILFQEQNNGGIKSIATTPVFLEDLGELANE